MDSIKNKMLTLIRDTANVVSREERWWNKPALQAVRRPFPNRESGLGNPDATPSIQQNCNNFWTNLAILIFFEIQNALSLYNIVCFMTISNRFGFAAPGEEKSDLMNFNSLGRAAPGFAQFC